MPFSLRLIILSFDLKQEAWDFPFQLNTRSHCKVINRHNFSIILSQVIGKPEERDGDGNGLMVEQPEHRKHLLMKFAVLEQTQFMVPQNSYDSNIQITEYRSLEPI